MNGFIVFYLHDKYEEEFYKTVPAQIVAGKLKYDRVYDTCHIKLI
jgi:hypothetical protein